MSNINFNSEEEILFLDSECLEQVRNSIGNMLNTYEKSGLILLEHPADNYSDSNLISLKYLINEGYSGVYISFQRPIDNLNNYLKQKGIDSEKLAIVDCTKEKDVRKVSEKINSLLKTLDSDNKFVFIDSLTTIALCNSEIWVDHFAEYIIENVKENTYGNITFIVNVAKDLCNKRIVENIASVADGVIDISNPQGNYSKNYLNSDVYT